MKGMLRWQEYNRGVMAMFKKICLVSIVGIFIVFAVVSCSGGTTTTTATVTPADYDSIKSQLSGIKSQLDSLQKDLADTQSQYDALNSTYNEIQEQLNEKSREFDTLKAQYDALVQASGSGDQAYQALLKQNADYAKELADLEKQYQELKAEHDLMVQQAAEINETNIEIALFKAINSDRAANGLSALLSGVNIPSVAEKINLDMAKLKQLIYDNTYGAPYQEVSLAAGYRSVDDLVNATMTVWKSDSVRHQFNILANTANYGTVDVVSEGGIYYITFVASNIP
jgi:archaellum component FlaC